MAKPATRLQSVHHIRQSLPAMKVVACDARSRPFPALAGYLERKKELGTVSPCRGQHAAARPHRIGETAALQQVIDEGAFGNAQVVYNMRNSSVGSALPSAGAGLWSIVRTHPPCTRRRG